MHSPARDCGDFFVDDLPAAKSQKQPLAGTNPLNKYDDVNSRETTGDCSLVWRCTRRGRNQKLSAAGGACCDGREMARRLKNVIRKIKLFEFQVWPTSFDTIVTLVCSYVFIGADWCYLDLSPATWTADFHDNHVQVSVQTGNATLVYSS